MAQSLTSHPDRYDSKVTESAQEGEGRHDGEAQQDEEHLEELPLRGVQLMWEDFHKGDVNKRPRGEPLQHGLDESAGC